MAFLVSLFVFHLSYLWFLGRDVLRDCGISWVYLLPLFSGSCITKTRLFKYIENFITKHWKFSDKNSDIFHISAQNIDCGYSLEPPRRGGSNEYPQSIFWAEIRKNNVYPCKPQFYYIKVGFNGENYIGMFSWWSSIVIILLEKRELVALLVFSLWLVYCMSFFFIFFFCFFFFFFCSFCWRYWLIGSLWPVVVAIPRHLLYYWPARQTPLP